MPPSCGSKSTAAAFSSHVWTDTQVFRSHHTTWHYGKTGCARKTRREAPSGPFPTRWTDIVTTSLEENFAAATRAGRKLAGSCRAAGRKTWKQTARVLQHLDGSNVFWVRSHHALVTKLDLKKKVELIASKNTPLVTIEMGDTLVDPRSTEIKTGSSEFIGIHLWNLWIFMNPSRNFLLSPRPRPFFVFSRPSG